MDEFLVVNDPATKFPDMLREYENFGGLVINWRLVGSSGEWHPQWEEKEPSTGEVICNK